MGSVDVLGLDLLDNVWNWGRRAAEDLYDKEKEKIIKTHAEAAGLMLAVTIANEKKELDRKAKKLCDDTRQAASFLVDTISGESKSRSYTPGGFDVWSKIVWEGILVNESELGKIDVELTAKVSVKAEIFYTCCCKDPGATNKEFVPYLKRINPTVTVGGDGIFHLQTLGGVWKRDLKYPWSANIPMKEIIYKVPCDEK